MPEYYLSEGCHYFAIALQNIFGYEIKAVVDRSTIENYGGEDFPLHPHIYCYDQRFDKAIDYKGVQTERNIRRRFEEFSPSLVFLTKEELLELSGRNKPYYSIRDSDIEEAEGVILEDENFYEV